MSIKVNNTMIVFLYTAELNLELRLIILIILTNSELRLKLILTESEISYFRKPIKP